MTGQLAWSAQERYDDLVFSGNARLDEAGCSFVWCYMCSSEIPVSVQQPVEDHDEIMGMLREFLVHFNPCALRKAADVQQA